ncbi:MAG: ABC transporter permease [Bacteroidetes bacterium]|nr:ABC transporter permease [Bacteroidota bacterium]MBU1579756.1 ABC transporter permease [Bacteroidota bacterium]MBU2558936.1 ABC transporter permease [Bacteroidota bacterium]
MFRNYFKIAIANLTKNKAYSIISISSLTIGLAVCILLLLYVSHELSFDRYHEKADNIYRLCQEDHPFQAPATARLLADNLPEIKTYARILPRDEILFQYEDDRYKEDHVAWVDAEIFEIFSFKFKQGSPENSLQQPGTAVINETIARKYFGNDNPVGKLLKVKNEYDYVITGVIEDMPENSHYISNIFMTLEDGDKMFGDDWMNEWGWENFHVYFEMQNEFSKPELERKISEVMATVLNSNPDDALPIFTVQQLKDIHLHSSHFNNDIQPQNSITYVLVFSAIGLLILLIASFNYINLLTANATTRGTEIGVRKAYGASRNQLALQYVSESFVVLIVSLILALVVVQLGLPVFNELSGKNLTFSTLANMNIILGILGMLVIVGLLAGWYPALVLSSFSPVKALKSSKNNASSKFQFRKILVGAQFTIVIVLIACAIIMYRQISFIQNKALGFEKEAVITTVFDFGDEAQYNTIKHTLLNQSYVSGVSVASRIPSGSLNNWGGVLPEGQTEGIAIPFVHVTFDYFKTLGIKPAQGRLFSEQFKTDAAESIILNEAAVKMLGIQGNPIGQTIRCSWPKSTRKIIGIVEDFHFESLYNKVKPAVFVIHYPDVYHMIVKVKTSEVIGSMKSVTEICQNHYPDQVIEFTFLDSILQSRYEKDTRTFQLMGYFAVLAIFLACIGLMGIASFMLARRTKEIGIRKVNGAGVSEIIQMLNLSFVKWIAVAFVIATPIAWYSMDKWLANFAYQTPLSWWIFVLSGAITLSIVLVTVSWLTYRAARRNPVEALRYE